MVKQYVTHHAVSNIVCKQFCQVTVAEHEIRGRSHQICAKQHTGFTVRHRIRDVVYRLKRLCQCRPQSCDKFCGCGQPERDMLNGMNTGGIRTIDDLYRAFRDHQNAGQQDKRRQKFNDLQRILSPEIEGE